MTSAPLIIGMTGRIGRLIRPFLPAGTLLAARRRQGRQIMGWDLDTGPEPLLRLAARHGPPTALIVLAGVTPATGPDMGVNVTLARAAMEAALAAGVGRVLLTSSAAVYDARREPWHEYEAVAPTSAYGAAKLEMERAAEAFRDRGLSVCALRIGNVAGADALLLNAPGPVVLDRFPDGGGPVRSYIGPETLARVLIALCAPSLALPPVLNVAAPGQVAMQDLARAAGFRWSWRPAPPQARQWQIMNCRALAQLVPIRDSEADATTLIAQWQAAQGQA